MDRKEEPQTSADPIEELLTGVLELDDDAQRQALEAICRDHPEVEPELREHYALYRRLLDGAGPPGDEKFGDYELIRSLGSGGMGTVYLARQRREGIERTVALKMIRSGGMRSPEARERFRREARAAFRIEHPAICSVYDVGEVDGTPYIAMRYVSGCSLSELIADARRAGRPLELPGAGANTPHTSTTPGSRVGSSRPLDHVLELFETLARALHAAHEAGLIHRDVKPGNVMVTPAGEPVLLDFGLVRAVDDESELTLSGQPLGTPSYMAPEQIAPRGAGVDRTVDVYELGATLYECVTLQPPFRSDTREGLYRAILETDARPAGRIVRGLPKDLDAILETALRKDPARRYPTALDFAEDLRSLRHREPVRARAAGPITRTSMWARRNPLASTVLVMLAIALAFAIFQERAAERAARDAQNARERAERGLTMARGAIDELVHTARDHLRDVSGVGDVREALLGRALAFHADLARDLDDDPTVLDEVAQAWEAVGGIQIELGRVADARTSIERAEAAIEALAAADESPTTDAAVGRVAVARSMLERAAGRFAEAEAAAKRALEAFDAAADARPANGAELLGRARALSALASILHSSGRSADALASLEDATSTVAAAAAAGAVTAQVFEENGREAALRARIARDLEHFDDADREFERSIAAVRKLTSAFPDDRSLRYDLATTLISRSRLRSSEGRYPDALVDADEAASLLRDLMRAFPGATMYAGSLAIAWNNRYAILMRLSRRDEAAESLRDALELVEDVFESTPANHEGAAELSSVTYNLGNLVRRSEGPAAAVQHYERSLRLAEVLIAGRPDDVTLLGRAGSAAENAAICYLQMQQPERADPLLARARRLVESRLERAPDDPSALRDLGRLRFNEAARVFEAGDLERAAEMFADATKLREDLVARNPSNMRLQYDSVLSHSRLASVLIEIDPARAGREAADELERLAALPEDVVARIEEDDAIRSYIGALRLILARTGPAAARPAQLARAWELLAIARDDPRPSGWARADALLAAVMLAESAREAGDLTVARSHLSDAVAVATPLVDSEFSGRDVRRAMGPRIERLQALLDPLEADAEAREIVAAVRATLLK